MIKKLFLLARVNTKLDQNKFSIIVDKENIHNIPPLNINSTNAASKEIHVKPGVVLHPNDLIYIYNAELDTDTKVVSVGSVTILSTDNKQKEMFTPELKEMILDGNVPPSSLKY